MAHGVSGVLSLLALCARSGVTVTGQTDAILRILSWLDTWRQTTTQVVWWPRWITLDDHRAGALVSQPPPPRPGWCYGIAGLVRAQQLAALALADPERQDAAERDLLSCLTAPGQFAADDGPGLCHGAAGVYHTVRRVAHDARTPDIGRELPHLRARLNAIPESRDRGFLNGEAGRTAAVLATMTTDEALPWETCLLST